MLAFFESISQSLAQLEKAIVNGNAREIELAAHSIKGSSGNMGVSSIAAIAHEIEKLGHNQNLDKVEALFERIQDLFLQIQNIYPIKNI